jgi:hypothetical protein
MLAYRGAGKIEQAEREQTLYQRFKADEASQAITGDYRRQNPEDNNERQRIHEHGPAVGPSYRPPGSVQFTKVKSTPSSNASPGGSQ